MARQLEKLSATDPELKGYITSDKWNEFDDSYLRESVKIEDTELGGFTRKQSDDVDADGNIHIGSVRLLFLSIKFALDGQYGLRRF